MRDTPYEKSIKQLAKDLDQRLFLIENYLQEIKNLKTDPAQTVYKFQTMFNGLIDLKERADDLTAPLDHA